jgi:hypothetical protein
MKRRNELAVPYRLAVILSGVVLLLAGSLLAAPGPQDKAASAQKLTASAIQVVRTQTSETLAIPEDFRVATYENVIQQIEKTKKFQKIYRDGDRTAASVPDLVILKLVPSAYTAGSQKQREVTTVKGATSIKINVQFTNKDGKVLLEKELEGKVRFYGENLKATYDFAKKVGKVVEESF